jgi:hypothetical protein
MYTDTDSLVLYLETQSIEEDMKHPSMVKWFEDSDPLHKGMPGFMKVEKTGILEFKAYCPKHYYYIAKNNGKFYFSETFKGIPNHARDKITQQEIEEHLKYNKPRPSPDHAFHFNHIRSKGHEVFVKDYERKVSDEDW